jgi:hypothetical protein
MRMAIDVEDDEIEAEVLNSMIMSVTQVRLLLWCCCEPQAVMVQLTREG